MDNQILKVKWFVPGLRAFQRYAKQHYNNKIAI